MCPKEKTIVFIQTSKIGIVTGLIEHHAARDGKRVHHIIFKRHAVKSTVLTAFADHHPEHAQVQGLVDVILHKTD